jgi:MerR family copper efflux transcriptional regulator
MKIGELAESSGFTTKTIRYYESIGLLDEPSRTSGGYRSYGADVVERLEFIRQAKASGLSLTEIGSILEIKDDGGQSCEHTRALLDAHLRSLDARIDELRMARDQLSRLSERAALLDPAQCTDSNRCQVIAPAHDAV